MRLTDELGTPFIVLPKDPASGIINNLRKKGYQYVVLPRSVYRTGEMPTELPPKDEDVVRWTRMHDCVKTLQKIKLDSG